MKRGLAAAFWVVLAVATFVLWPERWGGTMTYVITSGTSMQPAFQQGDLAVLRSADDYGVGDVVAYDSNELKRTVMHRIIKDTPQGFTLQGDNNDFVDQDLVSEDAVQGKLVLRVPGVGKYLSTIFTPINIILIGGGIIAYLADRKKSSGSGKQAVKPALGRLRLRSLVLPPAAVTAELMDDADLDRIGAHLDRPVLEVEVDGEQRNYVIDGSVVYTWTKAAARPNERRKTAQGRDWAYGSRHLQSVREPGADDPAAQVS